jgi:hypothetical protein
MCLLSDYVPISLKLSAFRRPNARRGRDRLAPERVRLCLARSVVGRDGAHGASETGANAVGRQATSGRGVTELLSDAEDELEVRRRDLSAGTAPSALSVSNVSSRFRLQIALIPG